MNGDNGDPDGIEQRARERNEQAQRDDANDARHQAWERGERSRQEIEQHKSQLVEMGQQRDKLSNELAQVKEAHCIELAEVRSAHRQTQAALDCTALALRNLVAAGEQVKTEEMSGNDAEGWDKAHHQAGEVLSLYDEQQSRR